jgi:hypothetical protein
MALTFDAYPPPAGSSPAKLRDEIHRLSQRLMRARESYNQDFVSGDPEVPLDEQLGVIQSYEARLDVLTEELRQHDSGARPAAEVPEQASPPAAQLPPQPEAPRAEIPRPHVPQPQAPTPPRIVATGPGIANPDGSPLVGDSGAILRTEDAAVGEYVRHAADQRWLTATGRAFGEFDAICEAILAALAHKHGVTLEDERQLLARQVDARYRRDYG